MIKTNIRYFCKDYTEIENYQLAVLDETQIWDCHHRKEIEENKSVKQLMEEGLYYNRPPEELIFLTSSEHHKLHTLGHKHSEETKKKISENHGLKGKHHSEETRMKMSEARIGKHHSEEHKKHISEGAKGKKHKPYTEERKRKHSEVMKLYWIRKKLKV